MSGGDYRMDTSQLIQYAYTIVFYVYDSQACGKNGTVLI